MLKNDISLYAVHLDLRALHELQEFALKLAKAATSDFQSQRVAQAPHLAYRLAKVVASTLMI